MCVFPGIISLGAPSVEWKLNDNTPNFPYTTRWHIDAGHNKPFWRRSQCHTSTNTCDARAFGVDFHWRPACVMPLQWPPPKTYPHADISSSRLHTRLLVKNTYIFFIDIHKMLSVLIYNSLTFNAGTSSIVTYTPMTELDYGTLLCIASNRIGRQRVPCVYHVIAAGN